MNELELECRYMSDYPGLIFYNDGRVFRLKSGRFLTGLTNTNGYKQLNLTHQALGQPTIHRLIARAFLSNPLNLPCINHKNGRPWDNRVSNLEWCTHKYNMQGLNTRRGFGSISRSNSPSHKKNPFCAQFKKNGEKRVGKWFATYDDAHVWLNANEAIARSELRVDM
jgi:hypothetical protein